MSPESVTLEVALDLLSLPKILGKNPENNEDVVVNNGRFGPYISCGAERRTIPADESPIQLTMDRALELLKQPRMRGRAGSQPKTLKEIGKHPVTELALVVKSGRYGPYVTDGTVNASLTEGMSTETLTLDPAVNLIDARAAKVSAGGGKPRRKAKGAAKPKATSAKTPGAKRTKKSAS
jgi:DNA topoisomerase-1